MGFSFPHFPRTKTNVMGVAVAFAAALVAVGFCPASPARAALPDRNGYGYEAHPSSQFESLGSQLQADQAAIDRDKALMADAQQTGSGSAYEQYKHQVSVDTEQLAYDRDIGQDQNDSKRGW